MRHRLLKCVLLLWTIMLIWAAPLYAMPGLNGEKATTPESVKPNSNDYVWWYMENPARRVSDGSMEAAFILHLPEGMTPDSEPEVYFAVNTWNRNGRNLAYNDDMTVYTKKLIREDGRYKLVLYGTTFQRFQVRARVSINGRLYYAQTVLNLFGDSQYSDPDAFKIDSIPAWPQLSLKYGETFFRAQLENPITLQINGLDARRPAEITVFNQHGELLERVAGPGGDFTYTPPYDKELMAAG